MLGKATRAMGAFLLRDLLASLRSPRLVAGSAIFGAILLGSAGILGLVATSTPGDGPLWQRGSDGALTTLAFAVLPLALPLLPVALVTRNLQEAQSRGEFDLTLSKPAPGAGVALGKAGALFAGVAIVLVPLSVASALLIQIITGTPVAGSLLVGFVVSNLILAALYILLALPIGGFLTPPNLPLAILLVWIAFNLVQPSSFVLLGELLGFLRFEALPSFEPMATDAATFTGLYQAFLAPHVPADLGFVRLPGDSTSGASPTIVLLQWAPLVWAIALLGLYSYFLARVPSR